MGGQGHRGHHPEACVTVCLAVLEVIPDKVERTRRGTSCQVAGGFEERASRGHPAPAPHHRKTTEAGPEALPTSSCRIRACDSSKCRSRWWRSDQPIWTVSVGIRHEPVPAQMRRILSGEPRPGRPQRVTYGPVAARVLPRWSNPVVGVLRAETARSTHQPVLILRFPHGVPQDPSRAARTGTGGVGEVAGWGSGYLVRPAAGATTAGARGRAGLRAPLRCPRKSRRAGCAVCEHERHAAGAAPVFGLRAARPDAGLGGLRPDRGDAEPRR